MQEGEMNTEQEGKMTTQCKKERLPQNARRKDDHRLQEGEISTECKKETGPQKER
jgi:hypothetical protein